MNQWHRLELLFHGENKKPKLFWSILFLFSTSLRTMNPLIACSWGWLISLLCPWRAIKLQRTFLQGPPHPQRAPLRHLLALVSPGHSHPPGHVESKWKPLSAKFFCPERSVQWMEESLERTGSQRQSVRNLSFCVTDSAGQTLEELRTFAGPSGMYENLHGKWSMKWEEIVMQILIRDTGELRKWRGKCLKMVFCANETNYSHSCELIALFPSHHAAYWQISCATTYVSD